jgi:HPt (histidine-containing phosphotransfer) domain-containing protein
MSANEYLQMYLEETGEFLESLGHLLLALEKAPNSITSLNEIFRIVHTIKGSAAVIELEDVSEAAHQMENLLTAWRKNSAKVTRNGIDVLLACLDALKAYHQELSASGQPPEVLNVPMEALNVLVHECSDGLSDVVSKTSDQIIRLTYTFGRDVQLQDLKAKLILVKLRTVGGYIGHQLPHEISRMDMTASTEVAAEDLTRMLSPVIRTTFSSPPTGMKALPTPTPAPFTR